MKINRLIKFIAIFVLIASFLSIPLYKTSYVEALVAKSPSPGYAGIHCGHKIENLKIGYQDKIDIITQFNANRFFKEEIYGKEIIRKPYLRRVKLDNGKIYDEIFYRIKTNNDNVVELIIGTREEYPVNTDFNVQFSKAIKIDSSWKSWKETDYILNTNAKIDLIFSNGKISITKYNNAGREIKPKSGAGCFWCEVSCEGVCEGSCMLVTGVVDPLCLIPCIALCHDICSGPCGG